VTNRFWAILAVVGVVALAAGVGIGAAIWAGGDHGDNAASMDMMGSAHGSTGEASALDEEAFLEQMVPHHESAIAMAQIALDKSDRPEIRRLAQGIITAQKSEIDQMKAWHLAWFEEELTPDTSGPHGSIDMGQLETVSGDQFDLAFLSMMIPHHASAITMAESVMMGSPRDEVTMVADEIIAAQAKEIGQMQRWRDQWFPAG
jgi:uncharacterized protein (DUF305 family)